jgi:hypothetical protein
LKNSRIVQSRNDKPGLSPSPFNTHLLGPQISSALRGDFAFHFAFCHPERRIDHAVARASFFVPKGHPTIAHVSNGGTVLADRPSPVRDERRLTPRLTDFSKGEINGVLASLIQSRPGAMNHRTGPTFQYSSSTRIPWPFPAMQLLCYAVFIYL